MEPTTHGHPGEHKPLTVGSLMSADPISIAYDAPISWAHDLMRKNRVRHLPVLRGEEVVGLLSLGDLHLLETLDTSVIAEAVVEDAMGPTNAVDIDASVAEVAGKMADDKLDAVLVVRGGKPVGVFTVTDALHAVLRLSQA